MGDRWKHWSPIGNVGKVSLARTVVLQQAALIIQHKRFHHADIVYLSMHHMYSSCYFISNVYSLTRETLPMQDSFSLMYMYILEVKAHNQT